MYFDEMLDLELDVSFILKTIVDALATMLWKAYFDGHDVAFVLGGVSGDDRACIEPLGEGSEAINRLCSQQGEWSHQLKPAR